MKMRQPHIVPLASQSLEVLRQIHPLTRRGNYVSPSARKGGKPLSEAVFNTPTPKTSALIQGQSRDCHQAQRSTAH